MWTDLTTVEGTLDCKPPFSFYFDLVGSCWKTAGQTNSLPLHRICTLARKQGATFVVLETALSRAHVRAEIDALDKTQGGGGAAEAISISFFSGDADPTDIAAVADRSFLGQAVVINYRPPEKSEFSHSYVFEGILPPPTMPSSVGRDKLLLNNYISSSKDYGCVIGGRTFTVSGVYYCQQNRTHHVCAHASLRMALSSATKEISADDINKTLGIAPPCDGLNLGQIVQVIEGEGLSADVVDCRKLERETYISILGSIIESGDQALLVFTTGHQAGGIPQEHVVLVYGHTRNSDEWHPQAIPAYAGPGSAQYLPASNWIDHFLIHDDNFGPYFTLSSQALEFDPDVRAHWIVAIRKQQLKVRPEVAEATSAAVLTNFLRSLATVATGRWFDYVTQNTWNYVLRTILVTRDDYVAHLQAVRGHDGSAIKPPELERLAALPDRFWMVEFSLPSIFTGNRTKLGEVLIDAQADLPIDVNKAVVGLRLPKVLIVRDPEAGVLNLGGCSLDAHAPIFRRPESGPEW